MKESEGSLSREQYQPGDFVSLDQYVVFLADRLVSNMFYGGTIFCDAGSKHIHVKNQVSLGAGETVNAKIEFEEWLWEEAWLAEKHYHSDNGIFTAKSFRESCEEEKQTQSFSGGAQHQNPKAVHAIQTAIYMACSVMVHTALHWAEVELRIWICGRLLLTMLRGCTIGFLND